LFSRFYKISNGGTGIVQGDAKTSYWTLQVKKCKYTLVLNFAKCWPFSTDAMPYQSVCLSVRPCSAVTNWRSIKTAKYIMP